METLINQSNKLAPLPGWEFNVFLFRVFWSKGRCGKKKKKEKKTLYTSSSVHQEEERSF
jgi:hypothetical protein